MTDRFRWLKNSSFLYEGDIVLYIDPWGLPADAPAADIILITHAHYDHFIPEDVAKVRAAKTRIAATKDVADQLSGDVTVVSAGDAIEIEGVSVDVVPAYNVRPERQNFHPKANGWVGYVFALGGTRYYHCGDTDVIPDMESVACDVAFLPIGGTYTMTAEEGAEAVSKIDPKVVVPMHYGFVAGTPADAERFASLVTGPKVTTFTPENPFELT